MIGMFYANRMFSIKDQLQYHFTNRIYSVSEINFEMVSDTVLDFVDISSPLDKAHGFREKKSPRIIIYVYLFQQV